MRARAAKLLARASMPVARYEGFSDFHEYPMPLPNNPIMFANNPLDRAGNLRRDPDWVKARLVEASNDPIYAG